jgi:2'-5' RNA ligase
MAPRGVPAHITLVFPFVPAAELGPVQRRRIARIVGSIAPFELHLDDVRRFPSSLYLAPTPRVPILELIAAIVDAFPEHQPYEGAFDEVIPHLTVAAGIDERSMSSLEPMLRALLPIAVNVRAVTVLAEDAEEAWRPLWRVPLGDGGPQLR